MTTTKEALEKARNALLDVRTYGCPLCGGDCGSANPPIIGCPSRAVEEALSADESQFDRMPPHSRIVGTWKGYRASRTRPAMARPCPPAPELERALAHARKEDRAALDLDAIKARVEAATPEPWSFSNIVDDEGNDAAVCRGDDGRFILRMVGPSDTQSDDVLFVAEARTDVPALIAEVERLRVIADGMATDDDVTYEQLTAARYQLAKRLAEIKARVPPTPGLPAARYQLAKRKAAEARATAAEEERDNTINYLNDARDQYEAAQRINAELLARASAAEAKLAEATEIIRQADHVIIWEHDPCLPPDFQERIEAFLSSLDKEPTP